MTYPLAYAFAYGFVLPLNDERTSHDEDSSGCEGGRMKPPFRAPTIEFGREYRDRISGFVGACTGKSSFTTGCDRALLVPKVGADGAFKPGVWFDDERLIDVTKR